MAQQRRVHNHLKAQEKAVQQQQSQFDGAVLELKADAAEWRAKLLDYERLLGNALSSKGIDICWREAQALRVKLDRQVEQRMHQLQQLVQDTCSALDATSTAFEAEYLKSFAGENKWLTAVYRLDSKDASCSSLGCCRAAMKGLACICARTERH